MKAIVPQPPELVLFVGAQASGKSTYYRQRLAASHLAAAGRRQVCAQLARGQSVVIDRTNATADLRREWIALGRDHGARLVGYYFATTLGKALARNALRAGRVPEPEIVSTYRWLERPSLDEGFHELRLVKALFDELFFESNKTPAAEQELAMA
jgi:predicted kinase